MRAGFKFAWIGLSTGLALAAGAQERAEERVFQMSLIDESGKQIEIGTITVAQSRHGVLFTPELTNIVPGLHGFHVHENPDCGPGPKDGETVAGGAAGGHHDPMRTNTHEGPYGEGHLGDLPALFVNDKGEAAHPVLAPRLKVNDLDGRSLVIHEDGDNYSDQPQKDGGGGKRVACGLLAEQVAARAASR